MPGDQYRCNPRVAPDVNNVDLWPCLNAPSWYVRDAFAFSFAAASVL
jgi:hypothetical protein